MKLKKQEQFKLRKRTLYKQTQDRRRKLKPTLDFTTIFYNFRVATTFPDKKNPQPQNYGILENHCSHNRNCLLQCTTTNGTYFDLKKRDNLQLSLNMLAII